jgi:hypothetical protein
MKYKPFLSHKRQKARTVAHLKRELCIRGAGGWTDTEDIPVGQDFATELINAIDHYTGGFIWWATKDTLTSPVICETELPVALERARRDATYSVVPVFVELRPGRDEQLIKAAIGPRNAKTLLGFNGVVPRAKQSLSDLARQAASHYVKQLVEHVPEGAVEVAITAFRAPTEQHDVTMDWRTLFDPNTRVLETGAQETIIDALADIREAMQRRDRSPLITVELTLPLPLAMLVGYEWRHTTQMRVSVKTVNPATGSVLVVEPGSTGRSDWPSPRRVELDGSGPFVLAVSVGSDLGATVDRYAAERGGRGFEALHVDRDPVADPLDAHDVRGLAAHVARKLNQVHAEGVPRHLLVRGPASLAAAIGLAANGTGPTWVPFYDGHDYYVGGVWIG